jgi:hypothetical protein
VVAALVVFVGFAVLVIQDGSFHALNTTGAP